MALDRLRKDEGGSAARLMMNLYYDDGSSSSSSYLSAATETPSHFARRRRSRREDEGDGLEGEIARAMTNAASGTSFEPNPSQREAVIWALQRNLALIRGPPGTGKTRCAALLIATAIRMELDEEADTEGNNIEGEEGDGVIAKTRASPRILAVTHSNGAADVLLQALLEINVPAVRAGRPASVSPSVQHRTIAALAERMPHVVRSRQQAGNVTLDEQTRQSAVYDAKRCMNDAKNMIVESASVVVTSCIGAQQLLSSIKDDAKEDDVATLKSSIFPIVVLDEAAQTTEPALISALVAARARQVIMVGDTRQLPPTVTSQDVELRKTLGVSPMERLLNNGIDEFVLTVQYRMPRALLKNNLPSPKGFPWPSPNKEPLAFLEVGNGCDEVAHNFGGGRSNPTEVKVIIDIIGKVITAGEIHSKDIAIITPYSKQVQLFRTELSNAESSRSIRNGKCKISDVKVGTVDSFQGQETDLVIFSAVRSNLVKELGFLRDARRLNVAITRARRGLIVVGDPTVLVTCRHWAALLNFCTKRNCVLTLAEYNAHHTVDMITAVTEESPNENDMRSLLLELDTDDKLCDVIDC
ncbi:hypothetical protein ACHAW5_007929 [Stephanodiscus triporus]|uniref:Uncharacterized protein n=1 Tax=Stephanodiscus triporus TaxID=2934178 RepID=A0ABD3N662_9STRA